jgi:glycosyltransferase involved in cell wall biosynthesis
MNSDAMVEARPISDEDRPILSICIPTYNRRERLLSLIEQVLAVEGNFELCVHVDGSSDGTAEALATIHDSRLRWQQAANQGRAGALLAACQAARGKYLMIYDDDDALYPHGLQRILADCAGELEAGALGFIYHLEDEQHATIGSDFPVARSNFMALRADHRVTGDKKEVVLSAAFKSVARDTGGRYRRVPTSLLWTRLALESDVICRNTVVGRKIYLPGGITAGIAKTKRRNAYPMMLLFRVHVAGYRAGRYRSVRFLCKAILGVLYYGLHAAVAALAPRGVHVRA